MSKRQRWPICWSAHIELDMVSRVTKVKAWQGFQKGTDGEPQPWTRAASSSSRRS